MLYSFQFFINRKGKVISMMKMGKGNEFSNSGNFVGLSN